MEVPKLRFKEYEDPWQMIKLGNLVNVVMGQSPDSINYNSDYLGLPLVQGNADLKNRRTYPRTWSSQITKTCDEGDIILTVRAPVGSVAISKHNACIGRGVSAIKCNQKNIKEYVYQYLIRQETRWKHIEQGSTFTAISGDDIKKLQISLPINTKEQQEIADFLQKADERIALLKQKKEHLECYKKGVMQKIFSQQLRFKDDNGKDFSRWEERKIKDTLSIGSGRDYKHLAHGKVPVYGSGGLMTYVSDFIYDGESVGIGRKGTINKPVYLSGKFWTVDTLFYTHSFKKVLPKYIYYCFLTINWLQHNEAGGVPSLTKSTIESIILLVPSLPEQQKISHFLTSIDEKISTTKNQLELTELWKKGLLQQMLV